MLNSPLKFYVFLVNFASFAGFIFCQLIQDELFSVSVDCYPASMYMFKVNSKNTRTKCEIGTKLWCLYCKLCTYFMPCSSVCIVDFEQGNGGWVHDSYYIAMALMNFVLRHLQIIVFLAVHQHEMLLL